jgi:predicted dehydrogenase
MSSSSTPIRVALVGYGNAGRIFHAPLISGVPGLVLHSIVSSKPEAVARDWPGQRVVTTPEEAFADADIDLVVIATSNTSHHPLAKAALLAGKHVVVDKPFTVTLAEAEDLLAVARVQQRVITVFQNRRFDADFLALKQVLASGELGRIVHFESHFDRFRPEVLQRWRDDDLPGSGLWFDLGAHLVDQALQLFGCPDDLFVDLAEQRDGARTTDYFHAQLRYGSRDPALRVLLHASALVPALGPRFAVHGTLGSFVKYGLDTQEDALKAGGRPRWDGQGATPAGWGRDPQVGQVVRHVDGQPRAEPAPDVAGNYLAFYVQLLAHLRGQGPVPVSAAEAHQLVALLARGEVSARQGQRVPTGDLRAN